MKTLQALLIGILTLSAHAGESDRVGNGGAAWVCRDPLDPKIILTAELYDFHLARKRGLTIEAGVGSVKDQTIAANARVRELDQVIANKMAVDFMWPLLDGLNGGPAITRLTEEQFLYLSHDVRTDFVGEGNCRAEAVAIYVDTEHKLYVNGIVYDKMSSTDQSGLITHESIFGTQRYSYNLHRKLKDLSLEKSLDLADFVRNFAGNLYSTKWNADHATTLMNIRELALATWTFPTSLTNEMHLQQDGIYSFADLPLTSCYVALKMTSNTQPFGPAPRIGFGLSAEDWWDGPCHKEALKRSTSGVDFSLGLNSIGPDPKHGATCSLRLSGETGNPSAMPAISCRGPEFAAGEMLDRMSKTTTWITIPLFKQSENDPDAYIVTKGVYTDRWGALTLAQNKGKSGIMEIPLFLSAEK